MEQPFEEEQTEIKIVFLGNTEAGKTSIISRYISGSFQENVPTTVGAMFYTKILTYDGIKYKIQIWDTAGQERFKTITPLYYKDAQGAIIVSDVTDKRAIHGLKDWLRDLDDKGPMDIIKCICGNKIDMEAETVIDKKDLRKLIDDRKKTGVVMTSALIDIGIDEAFLKIQDLFKARFDMSRHMSQQRERATTRIDKKIYESLDAKSHKTSKGCKC